MIVPAGVAPSFLIPSVQPGSLVDTTTGTRSFTAPHFNTLIVEIWGPGGGAGGCGPSVGLDGIDGTDSTFLGLTAGGGKKGTGAVTISPIGAAGVGGTASGGDINTNGNAGVITAGVSSVGKGAPNGGADVTNTPNHNGIAGTSPGGGAAGGAWSGAGTPIGGPGGSGAYVKKTYTPSILPPGTVVSYTLGTPGIGGGGDAWGGGMGGAPKISISWS